MTVGDGGAWLRKQSLILARNNNTSADFWLSRPLSELPSWIRANNAIVREQKHNK